MDLSPLSLAQSLLRCPSVTPEEGGALAFIEGVLKEAGFEVHRPVFSEPGTPDVENLYARGTGALELTGTKLANVIFGNAGDPHLPSNDAGLDVDGWTGTAAASFSRPISRGFGRRTSA